MMPATTTHTDRAFTSDDDWFKVYQLLIDTYPITPCQWNWDMRRWEGWRWYDADITWKPEWESTVRLWETAAGDLIGAAFAGDPGFVVLLMHPDHRFGVEEAMFAWAEAHIAKPTDEGRRQLDTFCWDYDLARRTLLQHRGFVQHDSGDVTRYMRLGHRPRPHRDLAPGYTLRGTHPDDEADCARLADLVNAAFKRTTHNPGEYCNFARHAPSFRHDLHLVAVAPDGTFAAHAGIPYDETNRRAVFEPVCTHPDHQRKGLAQSLMFAGLHRLEALGAVHVHVDTGLHDMEPANALYNSLGFTDIYIGHYWRKVW